MARKTYGLKFHWLQGRVWVFVEQVKSVLLVVSRDGPNEAKGLAGSVYSPVKDVVSS